MKADPRLKSAPQPTELIQMLRTTMLKKVLLGSFAGAIVIFIQAGFFFGFLFADYFTRIFPPEFSAVNKSVANFPLIFVADFLYAGLLSFLFATFEVETFKRGAVLGAVIGSVVVLHFDLISAATTYLKTPSSIVLNVAISAFMSGVGGGIIGLFLGKTKQGRGAV